MISLDNLTVSYGGWTLFDNISFLINPKDRIGLVGKNGAGKTTLLKLIVGEQQPTSGAVSKNGECTVGYLPQQMKVADTTTLVEETASAFKEVLALEAEIAALTREIAERTDYESPAYEALLHRLNDAQDHYHILGGETRDADIEKTLLGLGFKRSDFGRATSEFSGGWRMRIELPTAAATPLDLPAGRTDQPSGHRVDPVVGGVSEKLQRRRARHFARPRLSGQRHHTHRRTVAGQDLRLQGALLEIRRAARRTACATAGRLREPAADDREDRRVHREVPLQAHQIEPGAVAHQTARRIERIEVDEEDAATLNIKFPPAPARDRIVAEVKEAGMSFGAKHVFSGADFTIERGQKIALVGRNGEGKTTFARMLIGQLAPTEGSIRLGANVRVGYYAQNQDDLMEGEFTVYDTLDRVAVGDIRTRLRDILGAFLFRGEEIDKKVKVLSGGERSRLAMARLMLEPYNLLVLDEPTNHMDMRSKDILKRALQKYDGTVVVVSHDREFLDGIVDKVYEFRDGGVKEYLGGIYYFLEKRKLDSLRDVERKEAPAPAAAPKTEAPKLTYEQKKEQEKLLRKLRRAVESIETELAETERRIADYDARFAAATAYDEADYKAYDDLKAHYDHLMHEWEKAPTNSKSPKTADLPDERTAAQRIAPSRGDRLAGARRSGLDGPAGRSGNGQGRALPCSDRPLHWMYALAARPASVRCRTTRRTSWAKRSAAPTCSSSGLRPTGAEWPRG